MSNARRTESFLMCRVQSWTCALPLPHVLETMRPLPVIPVSGAPRFVSGLAIVRGTPIPVLDAARLIGLEHSNPTRFVIVKIGSRQFALAVDSLLDIRAVPAESLQQSPPLLGEACAEVSAAIGTLDSELLLVLRSARLMPESVWTQLENGSIAE